MSAKQRKIDRILNDFKMDLIEHKMGSADFEIKAMARLQQIHDLLSDIERDERNKTNISLFRERMTASFNRSETATIIFELGIAEGIDFDSLIDIHRELIAYLNRRNRLLELAVIVRRLRPLVDWPCCD